MRYLLLPVGFLLVCTAQAAGFGGVFFMENPQVMVLANLESRGERVVGIVEFGGRVRINLVGAMEGNLARGSATSRDGTGTFEAQVEGDTLSITISQPEGRNQRPARIPLVLQRSDLSMAEPAEAIREWLVTGVARISTSAMMLRMHLDNIRCAAGTDPFCTARAGRPQSTVAGQSTGTMMANAGIASGARGTARATSGSRTSAAIK